MDQELSNPFAILQTRLSRIEELLEDLRTQSLNASHLHPDLEDIGGMEVAEQVTGLARPTIYGLVSTSKIPFMKRGKKLYFSKEELISWIKNGRTSNEDSGMTNVLLQKRERNKKK